MDDRLHSQDEAGLINGVKIAKLSSMLTPILRLRYLPTLPSEEWLINLITVMLQPRYTYDELVKMSDRVRKGYLCCSPLWRLFCFTANHTVI